MVVFFFFLKNLTNAVTYSRYTNNLAAKKFGEFSPTEFDAAGDNCKWKVLAPTIALSTR